MKVEDRVIGRVSGEYAGYRNSAELVIDVRIMYRDKTFETTDHRWVHGVLVLAISMGVWNRAKTDFIICGQGIEALDNMVSYAPGWNRAKVQRLKEIWKEWHLNDMNAGCIHQDDDHLVCTETDPPYKLGSAWLARELPDEIIAEVTAMFA